MENKKNKLPEIVSQKEWLAESKKFLKEEKEFTKQYDALNAKRRRLPMVKVEGDFSFMGPSGKMSFLDLFDNRKQLIVYHAMLEPGASPCQGCSMVMDNIGHNLAHVKARDTTFVFTSPAPQEEIKALQKKMKWDAPWFTDIDRKLADAFDVGKDFGVNIFIRDDNDIIYRTYFTNDRGAELFDTNFKLLDLTAYGRQENWEDSPEGWPQTEPFTWWRLHNKYEDQ